MLTDEMRHKRKFALRPEADIDMQWGRVSYLAAASALRAANVIVAGVPGTADPMGFRALHGLWIKEAPMSKRELIDTGADNPYVRRVSRARAKRATGSAEFR